MSDGVVERVPWSTRIHGLEIPGPFGFPVSKHELTCLKRDPNTLRLATPRRRPATGQSPGEASWVCGDVGLVPLFDDWMPSVTWSKVDRTCWVAVRI